MISRLQLPMVGTSTSERALGTIHCAVTPAASAGNHGLRATAALAWVALRVSVDAAARSLWKGVRSLRSATCKHREVRPASGDSDTVYPAARDSGISCSPSRSRGTVSSLSGKKPTTSARPRYA